MFTNKLSKITSDILTSLQIKGTYSTKQLVNEFSSDYGRRVGEIIHVLQEFESIQIHEGDPQKKEKILKLGNGTMITDEPVDVHQLLKLLDYEEAEIFSLLQQINRVACDLFRLSTPTSPLEDHDDTTFNEIDDNDDGDVKNEKNHTVGVYPPSALTKRKIINKNNNTHNNNNNNNNNNNVNENRVRKYNKSSRKKSNLREEVSGEYITTKCSSVSEFNSEFVNTYETSDLSSKTP